MIESFQKILLLASCLNYWYIYLKKSVKIQIIYEHSEI